MQGKHGIYSNGTQISSDLYQFLKMYEIFVYKLGIYMFYELLWWILTQIVDP